MKIEIDYERIGLVMTLPSMAKAVRAAADFDATMAKIMAAVPKDTGGLKP